MKTPRSSKKSSINIKSVQKSAKKMMEDKNVLYIVAFLAFINILGYLAKQNGQAVIFFLIVGFLTTYFSKNMIVVLLTAMLATSLFTMSRFTMVVKEGMENEESDDSDNTDSSTDTSEKQPSGVSQSSSAKKAKAKATYKQSKYQAQNSTTSDSTTEGLAMPASESEEDGDEEYAPVGSSGNNHIDYSKTLESAYGNLEKILGEGGMKDISKTTQQLMEQQKMLMDNMNQMQPMMKAAEGFIDKVGGGPLSKLLGGALSK